jgi:hypothetical protein
MDVLRDAVDTRYAGMEIPSAISAPTIRGSHTDLTLSRIIISSDLDT